MGVYNNLACCLSHLDRPLEALAYLELAAEIMRVLAGEDHPRTQVALRNLEKARTAKMHLNVEIPHLFSYPVKDRNTTRKGSRRRKRKKHGGSSRGSSRSSRSSRGSRNNRKSTRQPATARRTLSSSSEMTQSGYVHRNFPFAL